MNSNDKKAFINGIYKDFVALVGIENTEKIFNEYRGQQITFPVEFYSRQYVYNQIIAEYDGENAKQLASKYGYSERNIRRILNQK